MKTTKVISIRIEDWESEEDIFYKFLNFLDEEFGSYKIILTGKNKTLEKEK